MKDLTDQSIKEFLENFPLYTWEEFAKPAADRKNLLIKEIDAYCETCDQLRPFHSFLSSGSGSRQQEETLKTANSFLSFSCVSCHKQHLLYCVRHEVEGYVVKIQKFGELPRKPLERDKVLQRFFTEDAQNYEKAIVCLANGYGIGAFAYFRRIIEGHISKLLDMLKKDAEDTGESEEILQAINSLRKESPMSDKIKIANNALPAYLKPDGLNPLGRLYQILSEGVHVYSDEECLKKAKVMKECVKFLISELSSRYEHRTKFKSMVESF